MNRARLVPGHVTVSLLATLVLIFGFVTSKAQDIQYTNDSVDRNHRSALTVDPSSLGLNLQIPFAEYSGRAGANIPIALNYSSKVWHMEYGGNTGLNPHANGWVYPVFDDRAGWSSTLDVPRIRVTNLYFNTDGTPNGVQSGSVVYRIQVTLADGSTHEMRKDDTPVQVDYYHPENPAGTYYSVDGSHMRLEYHTGANAPPNVLYLANGSRYIFDQDSNGYALISSIDRNGNKLVYSRNQNGQYQWTDTLGRTFGLLLPSNPAVGYQTYTLPGMGTSAITYTLRWRNLADVLTDPNQQLRYPARYNDCDLQTATTHSSSLFGTGTACDGDELYNQLFNPVLLAEIILPNGQSYKFTYNVFGELDKIVYPTGGYERFQHDTIPSISYVRNFYAQGNRGVKDRWISVNGSGTDENDHHWHYEVTYPNNTPPYKVTITAPDGSYTERYLHCSYDWTPYKLEDMRLGRAYDERAYTSTGQMLRRTLTEWATTGPMSGGQATATRNPRVAREVEILLDTGADALVRTTAYGYDTAFAFTTGVEQTSVVQYEYASTSQTTAQTAAISSMPQGDLVRTIETDYLDSNSEYRDRNLIGLVTATRVRDANNNIIAQSSMTYDEAAYPLLTYSAVSSWADPNTSYRGNVTTVGRWLNTTNTWLQTHTQYDQCGSVRVATDAKGRQSQISYTDAFFDNVSRNSYAFPTTVSSAVPDASGQSGSNSALVSTSVFEFNTGLATSAADANGVVSVPEYNDALLRPTRAVQASGNSAQTQGATEYLDSEHAVLGKSDLSSFDDNKLQAKTFYDGIGRTVESRTYEDTTNYIAVRTEYDSMGRAYKVSNPFRPLQLETPVWTITTFDALGRVKTVTTPDGAVVTTSYSGNTVTVTDQAGKKRRSVTDALGRLVRVDEPDADHGNLDDAGGTPVQSTVYEYDAVGNLTKVIQGSQTRTFVYDSLKRLLSAANPESGTVCYGTVVSGQCQNNGYDANGNLIYKTDARGVLATYTYDALNRNTGVSYSNDPANTAAVTRVYDGATNGKGRLWKTQTAGTSLVTIDEYDALGRPKTVHQQFYVNNTWSQPFTVRATYDKAGHVRRLTYPSDHYVEYDYDGAGRTLNFGGYLGDGTLHTYAAGISYSPFGGKAKEQFGTTPTPVYDKRRYNIRGQLYEIRASTLGNDELDWNRGAIVNFYDSSYGWGTSGPDNNGNVRRQQHWVPNNDSSTYYYTEDTFEYDSLNRLSSVTERPATQAGYQSPSWTQVYHYDRYGNRTITSGISNKPFTVDTATNRLGVPADQTGTMHYDAAGNLDIDTYSGSAVSRTYDAENRMTKETQANGYEAAVYTYDGDGQRVKRKTGTVETWQIYGLSGELLAEYAAQASPSNPQREYGYRNGELLITADAPVASINVALATNGGVATASSSYPSSPSEDDSPATTNNGDRKGKVGSILSVWNDAGPANTFDDWLQVDFNGGKTINEIDVFTIQDNWQNPSEPTEAMTFATYGIASYDVQYWTGTAWQTVSGGSVTGNNKVWRKFTFAAVTTSKVRVLVHASGDGYSRVAELEVWAPGSTAQIHWLVTDQLGTPRMIFDQSGSLTVTDANGNYLSGVTRHDYLPFGEELFAGTGGRTTAQGYSASDNVRQHFTQKERDNETGLDYFGARYYAGVQGRFTSSDPLLTSASVYDAQSWNRYSYASNNPGRYTDPFGLYVYDKHATQAEQRAFEQGLRKAHEALKKLDPKSDEYKKLERALNAYGDKGVDNGVTVKFGITSNGAPAMTEIFIRDLGNGVKDVTDDNPTGQNTVVTFDPSQMGDAADYASDIAHEGSHVADGAALIFALPTNLGSALAEAILNTRLNLTKYETETRAYEVSAATAHGLGAGSLKIGKAGFDKYEIWNSGWKESERATKLAAGIDKVLAQPKTKGGLYEVTAGAPGKKLIDSWP